MKKRFLLPLFAITALLSASPARAAASDPVLIGTYGSWNAYHFTENEGKVCFISSAPQKQEGKFSKRGAVLFFVTRWSKADEHAASVLMGYSAKPNSPATLSIKGKEFSLLTQGEKAWTKDRSEDDAVIKAFMSGSTMTVKGISARGTNTTDTYSLKGSADALRAITKECGA